MIFAQSYTDLATAFGTIGLALIAWVQLSKIASSNRTSILMAVLEQEKELKNRKTLLDNTSFEIREASTIIPLQSERLQILQDRHEIEIENYLNSADRLAFCMKNNYIPERDWKREYRTAFEQIASTFPDKLGVASSYTNFIDIHNKWKRE